jgi:hypothetical protein
MINKHRTAGALALKTRTLPGDSGDSLVTVTQESWDRKQWQKVLPDRLLFECGQGLSTWELRKIGHETFNKLECTPGFARLDANWGPGLFAPISVRRAIEMACEEGFSPDQRLQFAEERVRCMPFHREFRKLSPRPLYESLRQQVTDIERAIVSSVIERLTVSERESLAHDFAQREKTGKPGTSIEAFMARIIEEAHTRIREITGRNHPLNAFAKTLPFGDDHQKHLDEELSLMQKATVKGVRW